MPITNHTQKKTQQLRKALPGPQPMEVEEGDVDEVCFLEDMDPKASEDNNAHLYAPSEV